MANQYKWGGRSSGRTGVFLSKFGAQCVWFNASRLRHRSRRAELWAALRHLQVGGRAHRPNQTYTLMPDLLRCCPPSLRSFGMDAARCNFNSFSGGFLFPFRGPGSISSKYLEDARLALTAFRDDHGKTGAMVSIAFCNDRERHYITRFFLKIQSNKKGCERIVQRSAQIVQDIWRQTKNFDVALPEEVVESVFQIEKLLAIRQDGRVSTHPFGTQVVYLDGTGMDGWNRLTATRSRPFDGNGWVQIKSERCLPRKRSVKQKVGLPNRDRGIGR
ncbi:hypothetical protein K438DRAFT_1769503 [Mycena galopus ATCC 62051]|nr:hypothetical protein K438DRAFT_1769503 [Mycena galopus ATCC 62051]